MVVRRRHRRFAARDEAGGSLMSLALAATVVARELLGDGATLATGLEPVTAGYGPRAFRFRLAEPPDDRWRGDLILRLAGDGADGALAREAGWHAFVLAAGYPAPEVLARSADALVFNAGPSRSLTDRLGEDPAAFVDHLRLLGDWHARLHGLPADGAPAEAARPDDAEGASPDHGLDRARAWLRDHLPDTRERVVAHGDFQPAHLRLEPADPDSVQVTNWSGARAAPREWDAARTILTLWSSPYLASGRMERMMLKLARDHVVEAYLAGYTTRAELDDDRLRWFGVHHVLDWVGRVDDRPEMPDPWDPVALVVDPADYRTDLVERAQQLIG